MSSLSPAADVKEFSEETREASPANLLVKIKSFSLLAKHGIWIYESRVFEAGGYKWKLKIYPDGDESEEEGDHVGVYLCVAETSALPVDWEINALCSIFLHNKFSDNYLCFRWKSCRFHAITPIWGSSKMISKKLLEDPRNGYLVGDTCVFGAEVFVIKSHRIVDCLSLVEDVKPYKREWKISEVSKIEDEWISDDFKIDDHPHRWRIKLCPNGDREFDDRYASVFLLLDSTPEHQTVNVSCRFRLKNNLQHTCHHSQDFSSQWLAPDDDWGFHDFIKTSELHDPSKGFLINDCCFLEAEISLLAIGNHSAIKL